MASWTAESLLAMGRNFMAPRILFTGVELGIFQLLGESAKSLEEIVHTLQITPRGTAILLDALTALDLLKKEDGRYSCPKEIAVLLSVEAPETVLPMIKHYAGLWHRWAELTEIVRYGAPERPAGVFDEDEELAAFIGAMHVVGRHAAEAIAEKAQAGASHRLLDIGGATGTYAEAFLRKYPGMRATIFDRPPVTDLARRRLLETDLMDRVSLAPGDFYTDELPAGHDLALLSAIIHQNSPEQNVALYERAFRALVPGGRILIRDHVMNDDRVEPRAGAIFAVNMLTATTGGNCYTFNEIRADLETAGFTNVRLLQSGEIMDGLIEAFKPTK